MLQSSPSVPSVPHAEAGKSLTDAGGHLDTKLDFTAPQLLDILSKILPTNSYGQAWQSVQTSFPEADFTQILKNALQKNNVTGFYDHLFWHVVRTRPEIAKAFSASGYNVRKMQENCPSDQIEIVRTLLQICAFLFREIFGRNYGLKPDAIHPDAEVIIRQIDYALRDASSNVRFEDVFRRVMEEGWNSKALGRFLLEELIPLLGLERFVAADYQPSASEGAAEGSQKCAFYLRVARLCAEILPQALEEEAAPAVPLAATGSEPVVHDLLTEDLLGDGQKETSEAVRVATEALSPIQPLIVPPPLPPSPRFLSGDVPAGAGGAPEQQTDTQSQQQEVLSLQKKDQPDEDQTSTDDLLSEFQLPPDEAQSDSKPEPADETSSDIVRQTYDGTFDVFAEDLSSSQRRGLFARTLRRIPFLRGFAKPLPRIPGFSETPRTSRSQISDADYGEFNSLLAIVPASIDAPPSVRSPDGPQSRIYLDVSGGFVSPSAQGFALSSIDQHNPSDTRTGIAVSAPYNFFILGQESSALDTSLLRKVFDEIEHFIESSTDRYIYFYSLALRLRDLYRKHVPDFRFAFLAKHPHSEGEYIYFRSGADVEVQFLQLDPKSGQYKFYHPSFEVFPEMKGNNGGMMGMAEILKFQPQKDDLAVMVSGTMARFSGSQNAALNAVLNSEDRSRKIPVARQLQLRLQSWLQHEKADNESLQRGSGGALIVQL